MLRRLENGNLLLTLGTPRRVWHFVKPRRERWRALWRCCRDCPECRAGRRHV